jgi:hypothetical protein
MDLRISFQKIVMHLFFLLTIFYSFTDKDSTTVSLNTPENNAPIAVSVADILNRDALLQVNFMGNNSFFENGIVRYHLELSIN